MDDRGLPKSRSTGEPPDERPGKKPDPDADIVALVASGKHHEALQDLMRRHGGSVYRFCRRLLPTDALAEEALQMTFLDAYRSMNRFQGRALLRSWLFSIAHNRSIDIHRGLPREESEDGLESLSDPGLSGEAAIDDKRLKAALRDCLQKLDAETRAQVQLRFDGLSFEEMAGVFDKTAGTLEARVRRSIPILRRCIEKTTGARV